MPKGGLLKGFNFLSQPEDTLLSQEESDKVILGIESTLYIEIIKKIIKQLCDSNEEFDTNEIIYITNRAEIIDSINKKSKEIADIISEYGEQAKKLFPMSVVMAIALNEMLILLANEGGLLNIRDTGSSYVTKTQTRGEKCYGTARYGKTTPQNVALQRILERRAKLYKKRQDSQKQLDKAQLKEQLVQGLIQKKVLIEIKEGSGRYKISGITVCKSLRRNSNKISFSKTIKRSHFSIQRSISEHGYSSAFNQILEKIKEAYNLSENEFKILKENYNREELYS